MSDRVRKAMALDAIEDVIVNKCVDSVMESIRTTRHFQIIERFSVKGAIKHASEKYDTPFEELWHDTLTMMRDSLLEAIGGFRNDHEYIRPYIEHGETVGLMVNFYMFDRR